MKTILKRPKNIVKQMAEDKAQVIDYIQSGDESKRPSRIKFIKPFALPTE